jgi:hypothetical protein
MKRNRRRTFSDIFPLVIATKSSWAGDLDDEYAFLGVVRTPFVGLGDGDIGMSTLSSESFGVLALGDFKADFGAGFMFEGPASFREVGRGFDADLDVGKYPCDV